MDGHLSVADANSTCEFQPSRWTASSPQLADANAPSPASLRGCAGAAPAPCTPARSSSVVGAAVGRPRVRLSSQPSCGWQAPPADRLRASCSPNCSRPRSIISSSPSKPPSCKVGVSALEPAAGAGLRSSRPHPPIPHPPALLMGRACEPPCPARCSSVRLRRTRSIGGEASSPASFPPRRSAPRKLLAELLPARARSSPRCRRSLHPARSGCPPWSLRPEPASGPPGRTPQFHTRPPS
jgi:hypothetical protein